jgi:hypothetical protein
LQRNGRDLKQSPLWSETPTASESSQSTGPESPSSETCALFPTPSASGFEVADEERLLARREKYAEKYGNNGFGLTLNQRIKLEIALPSSPRGSLANLTPLRESVARLLTIVTSGPKPPTSFARFVPNGSSGKMSLVSSQVSLDGSLGPFCGTWPRWGIARDGACGELATLELCTAETGSLSWPTPHGMSPDGRSNGPSGNELGWAVNRLHPTMTARDGRTLKGARDRPNRTGGKSLVQAQLDAGHLDGSLNPEWVEWLMGFAPGWTNLTSHESPAECPSESPGSEPLVTPSSRSKPIRSSKPSRKSSFARNLPQREWLELRRLAHAPDAPPNTGSRMLGVMARLIRKARPWVTTLVSYSDTAVHQGTIYRAAGWRPTLASDGGEWARRKRPNPPTQSTAPKQRWEFAL